jgi:hypothetical protein
MWSVCEERGYRNNAEFVNYGQARHVGFWQIVLQKS